MGRARPCDAAEGEHSAVACRSTAADGRSAAARGGLDLGVQNTQVAWLPTVLRVSVTPDCVQRRTFVHERCAAATHSPAFAGPRMPAVADRRPPAAIAHTQALMRVLERASPTAAAGRLGRRRPAITNIKRVPGAAAAA